MKKKRRWQDKLTKKQLAHIREWCGGTLRGLKAAREYQRKRDAENPGRIESCRDCHEIAERLGLES